MEIISLILAGVLSGVCASMGLGGGFILLVYLSIFTQTPQLEAQLLNLCFFIPIAVLSIYFHARNKLIQKNLVKKTVLTGIGGVILGAIIATLINPDFLSTLFSVFILIIGLRELFCKKTIIENK